MYKWLFILDRSWSDESNKYNIYRFKSRSMQTTWNLVSVLQAKKKGEHDGGWIRILQILWSIALKLQIGKDDDKKESKDQKYIY
jgi:hypothetical protein